VVVANVYSVTSHVATLTVVPTGASVRINSLAGHGVSISFSSHPGSNYLLQFKDVIEGRTWSSLPPALTATGGVMVLQDTGAPLPSRFYRVLRE
jgi:hypothetical protein